jgi:hypothetical protein
MLQPNLRVVRREPAELTDHQIEQLMDFGRAEAALVDEMEAAARVGDKNLVWQLAEELVRMQDEVRQVVQVKEQ